MHVESESSSAGPRLKRSLSLSMVVLYGLGTTIGAGIYALIGEIAGRAGMFAPISFLIASTMAAFTAFSFAELSARFPRSAGEAVYVEECFGWRRLATLVGLLVVLAGTVSAATILIAFAGYLRELVLLPPSLVIAAGTIALGLIVAWGIRESVLLVGLITLLETVGLFIIIWFARDSLSDLPSRTADLLPGFSLGSWTSIFAASLLAFYAFLGFEDMVNVAEEVKNVQRNLPLAIIITLLLTTLLYIVVTMSAVLTVSPADLKASAAPLALVYERSTGRSGELIGLIGTAAIVNGALIQIVMASRILYGLAEQNALPRWLAYIHPKTSTPVVATATVTLGILVLALWIPIAKLAEATSIITLTVFALVNAALWHLKRLKVVPTATLSVPRWAPLCGFLISTGFVIYGLVT
jgi:APA family basic amino acid/polyamine antiporter